MNHQCFDPPVETAEAFMARKAARASEFNYSTFCKATVNRLLADSHIISRP